MGSDIEVSPKQINMQLQAVLRQLSTSGLADGYDSLADAIDRADLWDFLFNIAEVMACLHAFGVRDSNIIRELVHRRS